MRLSNKFHVFFILVMTAAFLPGCSDVSEPLRIGAHKWPGYEFMFLAKREGWLKNKHVHLHETGSATESIQALIQGKTNAAALTLDEFLRARAEGIPLQVVMVFDESAGADALIAKKKIKNLSELKGLRIGVEKTALGSLMLHKILESANLKESEVTLVNSSADQHLDLWQEDKVDAVITYEPVSIQLEQQGGFRVIDSRKISDLIFDVLAVRTDKVSQYEDALRDLISAHFKALQYFRNNPQDAAYRMATHLGLTGRGVIKAYRGLELPNEAHNRKYLSANNDVEKALIQVQKIMLDLKLLEKAEPLENLISKNYLPVIQRKEK